MPEQNTKKAKSQLENKIKVLLEKGKRKGFLTYDEINEFLPEDMLTAEQIDQTLLLLDDNGIEIIDPEEIKSDYIRVHIDERLRRYTVNRLMRKQNQN